MNNNNIQDINNTSKYIHKLYDKLTYLDMYGTSVVIFTIITGFVIYVHIYCQVMQVRKEVADDWLNQRCNPKYMPFAGYITHPEGISEFQYTNENFQYCVQNILTNVTGHALQPIQYMISVLQDTFEKIGNSIQQVRGIIDLLRQRIRTFSENILHRILNVLVPFQTIFIALIDTFQKIQGTMTAGLYTMLGTYYTLQALMGAIVELMVKMLMVMVIIIVGLWARPFSWPAAAAYSSGYLLIAVYLSVIILWVKELVIDFISFRKLYFGSSL